MTFVLTGLDIDAKADLVRRQLEAALTVKPAELRVDAGPHRPPRRRHRGDRERPAAVRRARPRPRAGRDASFSSAAVELALASYPGFTTTAPPGEGQVYGVFTAGYVDAALVPHVAVHADGTRTAIAAATQTKVLEPVAPFALPEPLPFGETRRVPLGTIAGARSGDKGGNANVGVWVRTGTAVAVAGPRADRREAAPTAARDSRTHRHPSPAAQPASGQLRHRGHPRHGRRPPGPLRPASQGARRMAASPIRRHPCRVSSSHPGGVPQ